jgi:hypothetical protein
MDIADYVPKRTLPIPHDPFHPENKDELDKYLGHCWQILVSCELLSRKLGCGMDGYPKIQTRMLSLWSCKTVMEPENWYTSFRFTDDTDGCGRQDTRPMQL